MRGRIPTHHGTCHQTLVQLGYGNEKKQWHGLFGEVLAWCLATEEQGRKSLHGHYLIFIRNWKRVMNILQQLKNEAHEVGDGTYMDASRDAKAMFANACSARLFADCDSKKPLEAFPVFSHENC